MNSYKLVSLFFYQCVGFGVEFVSHIVRAYCNASGKNEDRASEAITKLGASVFSGITITKFLGISVLAFSKSQVNTIQFEKFHQITPTLN